MLALTWLGHSTVVIEMGGVRLVTDPLLHRHAPPLRRRGSKPDRADWEGADAVLLSHLHHDHAELRSLRLLAPAPIVTARANAEWLRSKGLSMAVGLEDEWYSLGDDGVSVRLVPAVHAARPMPHRPNAANGHLIRSADHTVVWAAGDTELFKSMSELPSWAGHKVTVALMPIAGWGPRLSEGHLDPDEAASACALAAPDWVLPVHWGTLHLPGGRSIPRGWMDRALPAFQDALTQVAPSCRMITLRPGQRWELPSA
ncbi:MAG TPA: MBL fold metallo-hydrolase [Nocardioidaceae bacterium]|nr:MBL fold metallo-hydrolase [Nocardioidaceae bacterium]